MCLELLCTGYEDGEAVLLLMFYIPFPFGMVLVGGMFVVLYFSISWMEVGSSDISI